MASCRQMCSQTKSLVCRIIPSFLYENFIAGVIRIRYPRFRRVIFKYSSLSYSTTCLLSWQPDFVCKSGVISVR